MCLFHFVSDKKKIYLSIYAFIYFSSYIIALSFEEENNFSKGKQPLA